MALTKAWQEYEPGGRKLTGALGVYELGDAEGNVVYIGFAGGRSRFGLRGEIADRADPAWAGASLTGPIRKVRFEVNTMYLSRFVELLERHQDAHGALPPGNAAPGEYVPSILHRRQERIARRAARG